MYESLSLFYNGLVGEERTLSFSKTIMVGHRTDLIYYVSVECYTSITALAAEQYPSLLFCRNSLTGSFH